MKFTETKLKGAYIIDLERREDSRGFFARAFCQKEFAAHGLKPVIAQANVAYNIKKGTLRGMHFQFPPAAETKLVRCTRGAILDIIVDLRPESPTYLQHIAVELNEDNGRALLRAGALRARLSGAPRQHGDQLSGGRVLHAERESGLMYNDPRLGLKWPLPVAVISDKDQKFALLDQIEPELKRRMSRLNANIDRKVDCMIIVDNAVARPGREQGKPIRVAMLGAGFMAQGLTNQIVNSIPGMRMVAIYSRKPQKAIHVFELRRAARIRSKAVTQSQLEDAIRAGKPVVTDDAMLLARSEQIDVIVDMTGSVEFGAHVALEAFKHRKDVVLMNAELDATIGPILQIYAARHGVILSACEGDEPGMQMNLYRWVKGLGLIPRVMGNIKGLQDPYRNPTTQKGFAEKWGQNPAMVTSFADGSKISFEQAIVANATGLVVKSRGMSRAPSTRTT